MAVIVTVAYVPSFIIAHYVSNKRDKRESEQFYRIVSRYPDWFNFKE